VVDLVLWVEAFLVAAPGAWLALGAFENIRAPRANGDMVAEVLAMTRMKAEQPDYYALVSANRVDSPRLHRLAFAAIVIAESVSAVVMFVGVLALAGAACGLWGAGAPRAIAVVGTLGFTMVWSGFLVGGQWVHYWATHQEAQHTHFMLAIWGVVTLGVLLGL
jgi:predicted small integral membrane protein